MGFLVFLDASTHLHMRLCPSVGPSVRGSRVSQISRKSRLWDNKTSGNNEFKLIQLNSNKFKQIQENSFILTYIGRIFVRIELVFLQELDEGECGAPPEEENNECGSQQVPGGLGKADEYEWDLEDVNEYILFPLFILPC